MAGTVIEELAILLGLELARDQFSKGHEEIEKLKDRGSSVSKIFLGLGAAISGAMFAAVKGVLDVASEARKGAARLGTSVEAYQELAIAGQLAGVSSEELIHGLEHLSRSAYESKNATGEQAKAFGALGLSAYDAHGQLKPTDQLFGEVADKLSKLHSPAQRTALAFTLMGRGAGPLIPLLLKGSAGLEALREQARETGAVLGGDTVARAKQLSLSIKIISLITEGLWRQLGSGLVPVVGRLADTVLLWYKANARIIAQKIHTFAAFAEKAIVLLAQATIVLARVAANIGGVIWGWVDSLSELGKIVFKDIDAFGQWAIILGVAAAVATYMISPLLLLAGAAAIAAQDLMSTNSTLKALWEQKIPPSNPVLAFLVAMTNAVKALSDVVDDAITGMTNLKNLLFDDHLKGLADIATKNAIAARLIPADVRNKLAPYATPGTGSDFVSAETLTLYQGPEAVKRAATNLLNAQMRFDPGSVGPPAPNVTVNQTIGVPEGGSPSAYAAAAKGGAADGVKAAHNELAKDVMNGGGRAGFK